MDEAKVEEVVEEKVDEEVVVDVPVESPGVVAVEDVGPAIELPALEETPVEIPQVAVQDEGIVLSANTTASPVDVPLNISA